MTKKIRRYISILLSAAMVAAAAPAELFSVSALGTETVILQAADNVILSSSNRTVTFTADNCGSNCQGHIITQNRDLVGAAKILVESGVHNVTFSNLNLGTASVGILPGGTMNLTLDGSNTINAASHTAGIYVPVGAALIITEQSTGSLNAYGSGIGTGIGGTYYFDVVDSSLLDCNCGTVIINGGTITASGGELSAGIGGASISMNKLGAGGNIIINGGKVTAKGDEDVFGIGGAARKLVSGIKRGDDGNLTISSPDVLDVNTTLGPNGTYYITGTPTAEMLNIPTNLKYTSDDMTAEITKSVSLSGSETVCGKKFQIKTDDWVLNVTKVSDLEYTVTYTNTDKEPISKSVKLICGHDVSLEHHEHIDAECLANGASEYWQCLVCDKYFSDEACTSETTLENTVIEATGHSITPFESKEPTCTEDGNIEYWYCTSCKKYFGDEKGERDISLADTVISAGHTLECTAAKEATCTEVGNIEYWTCPVCKKIFSDINGKTEIAAENTVIGKLEHNYENGKCTACGAVDANHTHTGGTATCQAKAVCTICNEEYGELAEHSWNGGEVTKAATCTEKGVKTYTCTVDGCGATKTEDIEMLTHTEETIAAVAATCTATGLTEGKKCSVCDEILTAQTVTPIIPHNYENGKCTACGAVDANHTHTGGTATCQAKAVCTICNEEYGELAEHSWNGGEVTKAATCTEKGVKTYTCTVDGCGATKTEDIAMLPHTETEIPPVAATCTTAGSAAGVKCSVCETVLTAPEIISALGHKYGTDWTSDVLNHWHECTVCGDKTDTAAHTEDSGTVTVRPTTEAEGTRVYACKECGAKVRDEVIPVLDPSHEHEYAATWKYSKNEHWHECICGEASDTAPHIWDGGTPVNAPTCTEAGVMTYSCTVCGITKTEPVNALGHSFTNYVYNNDASCTEDGTETAVCDRCPEAVTRTAVGSKKGHTEDSGTVTKQPTETETGVKTFRCTVCGNEIRTETLPPVAAEHTHVYGTAWSYDTASHWHECECGEKADTASHISDGGTVTKQPTSTETGVKNFSCTVCGYLMNTEIIPAIGTPTAPVIPPYISSNPTVTTTTVTPSPSKEPFIQGDNGKTGWEAISDTILGTSDGGTVTVNMNNTTKLPKNIISQIQGRDIELVLDMGGFVWTINGLSVTKAKTVDMGVRKVSKIPKSAVDEYFDGIKTIQLDLKHNGDFGFTAELTVDLGGRYDGLYANSYCYKSRTFEFGDSAEIVNGQAKLRFSHASSWLITVESSPVLEDVSSASGAHSDGIPINAAQMTNRTADVIFCEAEKLRVCRKKRRYRILKKRRLDDLVFVF